MTTSSVDPVRVWAMTFRVVWVRTPALSVMVAWPGCAHIRAPSALLTLITGILTSVFSPNVAPGCSPSTLFATIRATAPPLGCRSLLGSERAPAAVHQHDRASGAQSVVVACRAAGGVLDSRSHQWSGDTVGWRADGVLQRLGGKGRTTDGDGRGVGEWQPQCELRRLDVKPVGSQGIRDVIDAGLIAGRSGGPIRIVGVGDLLQRPQVRHHRVGGHPLAQHRCEISGASARRAGLRRRGLGTTPSTVASVITVISSSRAAFDVRRTRPTVARLGVTPFRYAAGQEWSRPSAVARHNRSTARLEAIRRR